MFEVKPITLNFITAPSVPTSREYPVLVVDKTSGTICESWNVWTRLGRAYAQLTTNKFIVEIVGWVPARNNRVEYEQNTEPYVD